MGLTLLNGELRQYLEPSQRIAPCRDAQESGEQIRFLPIAIVTLPSRLTKAHTAV